jgi:hypothetical protein
MDTPSCGRKAVGDLNTMQKAIQAEDKIAVNFLVEEYKKYLSNPCEMDSQLFGNS